MTKTPEQLADEFAKGMAQRDISMRGTSYREESCLRIGFLAGYEAGRKITDQEIVDIIVDIREREVKERSKMPPLQQERHDHIWEKIKVKLVGIF